MFLLNILLSLDFFGKCLLISFRNVAPMFVVTLLLNGGVEPDDVALSVPFFLCGLFVEVCDAFCVPA